MTKLESLKNATSLHDVAKLLGYKPRTLSHILYIKKDESKYNSFTIPKKSGGVRTINAPYPDLKLLQKRLGKLLEVCNNEINQNLKIKKSLSHGFRPKHSIITNALNHRKKKFVFNLDLSDFFGTINFGRVRGFFISNKNFALHKSVATVLAQIACHDNALPQGSPCSPVISNLIGHILDIKLAKLAFEEGCTYTRYADDLTFSTNEKKFPENIGVCVSSVTHEWIVGKKLETIIADAGFTINHSKTRLLQRFSRQDVTGLVVNNKINTKSEYRHSARAMVNNLITKGSYDFVTHELDATGNRIKVKTPGTLNQLDGILSFIDSVTVYNLKKDLVETKKSEDLFVSENQEGSVETYKRFLRYKNFHATSKPVILFEGVTDEIYFKCALKKLAKNYPKLVEIKDTKLIGKIRFFKRSRIVKRILGYVGGSGEFLGLVKTYQSEFKKSVVNAIQHPVIIFLDNDDGAKGMFGYLKLDKNAIGSKPFHHIGGNLYLVATPLSASGDDTMIESFFEPSLLATIWKGRTFHPEQKGYDGSIHYSKKIFAEEIVNPNQETIDFKGFKPLLKKINAVIVHYQKITSSKK